MPREPEPLKAKFRRLTEKMPNGCVEWRGSMSGPYGNVYVPELRRGMRAHRAAWYLEHGEWPGELYVCHKCDNPPCVNPDHLFLGTQQANLSDMKSKGRKNGRPRIHEPYQHKRGPHVKHTPEELAEIRQMWVDGVPTNVIADKFNIKPHSVYTRVKGLKRGFYPIQKGC